jgi:Domain of Unknown Function (DUF1080)
MRIRYILTSALLVAAATAQTPPRKDHSLGYDDTPFLPDGKWRVHDVSRPRPKVITPGAENSQAPSDAIVLFDGSDLSKWETYLKGKLVDTKWKVENGYMEVVPATGSIQTKDKFGDIQLHVEWATPGEVKGNSQSRGNSGILLMSRYEIQVLDSYDNPTYADGQAAAIYGQVPPADECFPQTGRVADLRYRFRSADIRRRQTCEARLRHCVSKWRSDAQPAGDHRPHPARQAGHV